MTLPHTPAPAAPTAVPHPTPAKVGMIIVGLILFLILLVVVITIWNNRERSYDLANTKYNHILEFSIKPGRQVRVKMTYDYSEMSSSGPVERYNFQGTKVTLDGDTVTPCDTIPSTRYVFVNKENHSITIKIGRCKSKKDCKTKF